MIGERGLPVSIDVERSVLGCVLLNDNAFAEVSAGLEPEDFSLESHRRILRRMADIAARGERIDRVTIAEELMKWNELESVGGLGYLVHLDDGLPQNTNVESYVRIVKEKSTLRRIVFACEKLQTRAFMGEESPDEIIEDLMQTATGLQRGAYDSRRPISTREMIERDGADKLLGPREVGSVPITNWPELQKALKGFHAGQVILLMAATSRGKTSFALQAATCAAVHGQTPIVWTLEMSPESQFKRMVNQLSGVNASFREVDSRQRGLQRDAVAVLNDKPVYFDRHSRSVGSFISTVRQVRAQYGAGFAVVDYLQLIRGSGRSRAQEVSENSRALKLAAMDLGIPILVLSQVDRGSVKGDGEIGLHSAKESGDIENDADVVLWIKSQPFARDHDTILSLHVGKQREGPTGFSIPMIFRPGSQTFMEIEGDGNE